MTDSVSGSLAALRDAKFKKWLQNKSIKDKAFEYLDKLNPDRGGEEDSLVEVAICLAAVDKLLGGDEDDNKPDKNGPPRRTLKSSWFKWTFEHHTFSMVRLSSTDMSGVSGGLREFLISDADIISAGGGDSAGSSQEKNILPSLKYFYPAVPKPNEKPRPLTSDQKLQNSVFNRECRKLWKKANELLNERLLESVARGLQAKSGGGGTGESEQKMKASSAGGSGNNTARSTASGADAANVTALLSGGGDPAQVELARRLEVQCLNDMSLKKMKLWIEEDEDTKAQDEHGNYQAKLKEAKSSHEQWTKRKDSLRIRMPLDLAPPTTSKLAGGTSDTQAVRPDVKVAVSSTVDMMAGLGLKFVHATNRGRQGQEGDLERSRKKLLKVGYVDKANFDPDDVEDFQREKENNPALLEKQEKERRAKEYSSAAFDDWLVQKELRDQALKCLAVIAKPKALENVASNGAYVAATARDRENAHRRDEDRDMSRDGSRSQTAGRESSQRLNLGAHPVVGEIIEVGQALKKVDRTLYPEWSKWCEEVISPYTAQIMWDSFTPRACDVHSPSMSQVRDTFMKLLRPGLDFKETFIEFVEKRSLGRRVAQYKMEKGYDNMDEAERKEFNYNLVDLKKEWLSEIALGKNTMAKLLRSMGVAMKDGELRTLVDAFDANGDGVVTLSEFLDFTGPKRDKKGGASAVLGQRCCFLTTCRTTGMAGAYCISAPTKRFLAEQSEVNEQNDKMSAAGSSKKHQRSHHHDDEDDDEYGDDYEQDDDHEKSPADNGGKVGINGNKSVLRKLANGEARMCVELAERGKREDTLRRYGLLDKNTGKASRIEEEEEEDYEDDYEDDDKVSRKNSKKKLGKSGSSKAGDMEQCEFAIWDTERKREGLKYLMDISRDAREEQALQTLLSDGKPPKAPQFWINKERVISTKSLNRSSSRRQSAVEQDEEEEEEAARECRELLLFWAPQKDDLVSFYSIEYAGPSVYATGSNVRYQEIFRDPEDADPNKECMFTHVVTDLQPGVSYAFRIRAMNGFGSGDYTYKTFTTRTEAPVLPRVLRLASDSVTLRWTFSKGFFRRMAELKRIFQLADVDGSGEVSREELTAVLDEKASGSPELKAFLNKIATGMGLDLSQGYGTLFDMIEGDDDGGLSWDEFESFFMGAGWGNTASIAQGGSAVGTSRSLRQSMGGSGMITTGGGGGGDTKAVPIKPGDITYIVERCENEFEDKYVECLRTSTGQGTINRLEAGKSYRFRVYSLNADGVAGRKSPSILVHSLLETPPPPSIQPKHIGARKIILSWKARDAKTNSRDKAAVDKMLGDWAHSHGENDGGVSIEAAFAKYDRDRSGDIDASELALMLEDLGVEVSDERLSEAFALLDANGDGIISYQEFGQWWRRDEVTYVIKRSEEILPSGYTTGGGATRGSTASIHGRTAAPTRGGAHRLGTIHEEASGVDSVGSRSKRPTSAPPVRPTNTSAVGGGKATNRQVGVPIVSYRGAKTRCEIAGLQPNKLYHFKLRYVGSRSNSMLGPPLVLMTAPMAPPRPPVLIDCTSSSARLKWYAPEGGCFKFMLHLRQGESSNTAAMSLSRTNNPNRKFSNTILGAEAPGGGGWVIVYNGQDTTWTSTTLASDTTYSVRVVGVNCQGTCGEASPEMTFTTLPRNGGGTAGSGKSRTGSVMASMIADALQPKNAANTFTIECTGDICVGDTILITERLFARQKDDVGHATSIGAGSVLVGAGTAGRGDTGTVRGGVARSGIGKAHTLGGKGSVGQVGGTGLGAENAMNQSVTSLAGIDGVSITATPGQFVGERTVAAYVSKDNYRTIRSGGSSGSAGVDPHSGKKFATQRKLWLEVVWQRSSNEKCKPFELRPGEVLERFQAHLEQFEVFRGAWKHEKGRMSLHEEWASLSECFQQTDC